MQRTVKLATRLSWGLGLLFLLLGAVVGLAIEGWRDMRQQVQRVAEETIPKVVQANLLIDRANEIARAAGMVLLAVDDTSRREGRAAIEEARRRARAHLSWLRQHQSAHEEVRLLDEVERARSNYVAAQQQVFSLLDRGEVTQARQHYVRKMVGLQDEYVESIGTLTRYHGKLAYLANKSVESHSRQALFWLVVSATIATVAAITFGIWLARGITGPLHAAVGFAGRVADGDLDLPAPKSDIAELARLLQALEGMARRLAADRQAIRESERLFRLLAEHASDVISLHTADCRYTYLSPACETVLGQSAEALRGKRPDALIDPDDLARVRVAHTLVQSDQGDKMTFRVRRPDGSRRWIEAIGRHVGEGASEHGGIVTVMRDVTDRYEAEQRLLESRELLAQSQEQASLGSWWYDLDSSELTLTDEVRRVLGAKQSDEAGVEWLQTRVHPEDWPRVEAFWNEAIAGTPSDVEYRLSDGEAFSWVRVHGQLRHAADGRPLRIVGIVQDVTEDKLRESELLDSRQLLRDLAAHREQERERERLDLSREIHDEMGQYLTAVRMDAALLRKRFADHNPEITEAVAGMTQNIDLAMVVLRQVVARLRPGALDAGLVSAAEWLLDGFERRTGIDCKLNAPADDIDLEPELATASFRILQESLTNISRHANATHVVISISCDGDQLRLEVCDNGIGFDPDAIDRHKTFGLLGMRERALMFSGSVRIDSAPGGGTTLRAILPIANVQSTLPE